MIHLNNALHELGFHPISRPKMRNKTYAINDESLVIKAFCPYISKKSGLIAVSGTVGLIDVEYQIKKKLPGLGVDIFGRHMLSLTAEIGIPWYIEPEYHLIYQRVLMAKEFLISLPNNKDEIVRHYTSGTLHLANAVFDRIEAEKYTSVIAR